MRLKSSTLTERIQFFKVFHYNGGVQDIHRQRIIMYFTSSPYVAVDRMFAH